MFSHAKKIFKPGEHCEHSGIYRMVDEKGKHLKPNVERTVIKGEPFPPSDAHGHGFVLARAAKHKND